MLPVSAKARMTSDWRSSSLLLRGAWLTSCEPQNPKTTLPHLVQSSHTSVCFLLRVPSDPLAFLCLTSSTPTMLRNGASRLALRSIGAPAARPATGIRNTAPTVQWATQFGSLASRRPRLSQVASIKPIQTAVMRRTITDAQKQAESRYSKEEIKPTPETVSTTSSTHAMFGEVGVEDKENKDADMMAGLNHDVVRSTRKIDAGTRC